MDFLSLGYIAFTAAALVLYYKLPRAHQWKVLLAANLLFYLLVGKWNIAFILVTAFSVWYAAIILEFYNMRKESIQHGFCAVKTKKQL